MAVRVSGGTIPMLGVRWEVTPGDRAVARDVVSFLEDRRVLFGVRHLEDEMHCVLSCLECRKFLTEQIARTSEDSPMREVLKAMRAVFRLFVERAGPDAINYRNRNGWGVDAFSVALGELRIGVGYELCRILWRYQLDVDDELASILPPEDTDAEDDVAIVPGLGD